MVDIVTLGALSDWREERNSRGEVTLLSATDFNFVYINLSKTNPLTAKVLSAFIGNFHYRDDTLDHFATCFFLFFFFWKKTLCVYDFVSCHQCLIGCPTEKKFAAPLDN